jgi:hypothetical protein
MPGYLFAFDVVILKYASKPYTKIDCLAFGILMAMLYNYIYWYSKEATSKDKERQGCLNWLHSTTVAPWLLWVSSLIFGALFFGLQMWQEISNESSGGIPETTKDEYNDIVNAICIACGRLSAMLSNSFLMAFLFTGNSSILY